MDVHAQAQVEVRADGHAGHARQRACQIRLQVVQGILGILEEFAECAFGKYQRISLYCHVMCLVFC